MLRYALQPLDCPIRQRCDDSALGDHAVGLAVHNRGWREHVTLYAKENPESLTCAFLDAPSQYARPDLSFTVDRLDEYLYTRRLAERFKTVDFDLKNMIQVADEVCV